MSLYSVLLVPTLAVAQVTNPTADLPKTKEQVINIFVKIGNWLFTGLLIISVIMILVGAYQYLFSGGSEEKTGSAKKTIVYAVVALAVAMLAKGIPTLVHSIVSTK